MVFTLHKIEGKSYNEISEITNKSLSSVESVMFRAKKNLQKNFRFKTTQYNEYVFAILDIQNLISDNYFYYTNGLI